MQSGHSASLSQTRSWARLSNMPSIQWWLARLPKFQATEASACPIAFGAIDQSDIVEFGTPDALGLHDPEQTGFVQIALGFGRQPSQFLRARRAVAKLRNKGLRAGRQRRERALIGVWPRSLACAWPFDQHLPCSTPPLDRLTILGDCLSLDQQLRRGRLCPSIENQRMGAHNYGQDRRNHRAWHHGRRDCAQPDRTRMAGDRFRHQFRTRAELAQAGVAIAGDVAQVVRDAPIIMTSLPDARRCREGRAGDRRVRRAPRIVIELSTLTHRRQTALRGHS